VYRFLKEAIAKKLEIRADKQQSQSGRKLQVLFEVTNII